jgi:hypothetical protein
LSVCGIVAGATAGRALADGAPQRTGTVTRTIRPAPKARPTSIEERLAALEKRVEDLEHDDIEQLESDEEEAAREKRLESRLAALEKARPGDTRPDIPSSTAAARGSGPLMVRAPFVVLNGAGEAIFEIGLSPENGQPELILGDRAGARARLGVTRTGGASLALYDRANSARLAVTGNPTESLFRLGGRGQGVEMSSKAGGARIDISNTQSWAVVTLQSRNEHGHFTLGDANGDTTVEAATLRDSGVGVVRVGPDMGGTSGAMAGGVVVPRAIRGRKAP